MLELFFYHQNFMTGILILLSLSILCQIISGVIYHRLIKETENMSITRNKFLQQLKLKYSSCCKINEGVPNVSIFVDKYLSKIKVGPLSLSVLKHLSGQFMLLAVLVAGIGACLGIVANESFFQIAPFYIVSFLGLYFYFSISSLTDISGKVKMLHTNLVDYLENHLTNQMQQAEQDMLLLKDELPVVKKPADKIPDSSQKEISPAFSKSEAEELETLLKEFLT